MGRVLAALCALVFPLGLSALAAQPVLTADDARHLLTRTGFAAAPAEIKRYAGLTREAAADRLLSPVRPEAMTAPPAWTGAPFQSRRVLRTATPEERQALQRQRREQALELRSWWLEEMRRTPSPLTEKMTLFWHNHFVSSEFKVRSPLLMYRQNVLLRNQALGNFATLLHAVARDPAMVIYLDSASNRKGRPNENFAREVMELFTLGEGNYTESDIKEAARAFTGWGVDIDTGEFVFRPLQHDDGAKTVLGRNGELTGDDVLDVLLENPRTAEHIVAKLWTEFVSATPDAAEVKRIAAIFRTSGYDVRSAVRALLVSDAFYAPENRANLVKSPVELVVGALRQFDITPNDMLPFALVTAQLGQNLFAPPNVKGWPGGDTWINSTTLLARKQFLELLFTEREPRQAGVMAGEMNARPQQARAERLMRAMAELRFDPQQWLTQLESDGADAVQRAVLAAAPAKGIGPGVPAPQAVKFFTQDPVYQLK